MNDVLFVMLCATVLTGSCVVPMVSRHFSVDEQLYLIGAAMVMWGFATGVYSGPAQALFADSLPLGERSKWYSYLAMCYMLPGMYTQYMY